MIGKGRDIVVKINIFKKYTSKEMEGKKRNGDKVLGREGQRIEADT